MGTQTAVYTKYVESELPNDIKLIDNLASLGWVMTGATYNFENKKYVYWFQSKRRIYENKLTKQSLPKIK